MNMINEKFFIPVLMATTCILAACTPQTTPSMMNTQKPRLVSETAIQQIAVKDIKDGHLRMLAADYDRYGADAMNLSLVYDPKSKSYGAMNAFNDLARIKGKLNSFGVRNVTAETMQGEGDPVLMISYDALKAAGPSGCTAFPGVESNETTRFVGDYRFGCTTESMLAKQIYRPSDLGGRDYMDPGDGRRATNSIEHYRVVTEAEANREIDILTRDQISQ
jgi:type IV pilus biogenesis protein CpaD/CtpE